MKLATWQIAAVSGANLALLVLSFIAPGVFAAVATLLGVAAGGALGVIAGIETAKRDRARDTDIYKHQYGEAYQQVGDLQQANARLLVELRQANAKANDAGDEAERLRARVAQLEAEQAVQP
ncbi:hypothetical protein [Nonomuraea basaltis]|uniref:hypothetical protein n=1 Tax=Nonomuraea basaltis TaxID=2495887 RepID=UPI00110C5A9A|nr:hypothetical protein [Nonomuraea basaltis]TMR90534.1 hypothetical protein EJK15_54815 [Nonomuraea basaltis]